MQIFLRVIEIGDFIEVYARIQTKKSTFID